MMLRRLFMPQRWRRYFSSLSGSVPNVAIVGSGPAGYYTAQQIVKGHSSAQVDIYEKLPVPFGLVRFGIAPDHPEVKIYLVKKNVINTFTQIANNTRCQFLGNVNVGKDVTVEELRKCYTAVVLAYGADEDKTFSIPGEVSRYNNCCWGAGLGSSNVSGSQWKVYGGPEAEAVVADWIRSNMNSSISDLQNVLSARSFVGWYNGLPRDCQPCLDMDTAVILGQGNVAIDVARILLSSVDSLRTTDITEYALDALSKSRVRRVILIGRRGPLQVAFTPAELRELIKLPGCRPVLNRDDFINVQQQIAGIARSRKRLTELMIKTALGPPSDEDSCKWKEARNEFHLRFLQSPTRFLPSSADSSRVGSIELAINRLESSTGGDPRAVPTGEMEQLQCGLVLRSIGYRSQQLDSSMPFDSIRGILPNETGRVLQCSGLYCSGWVKRGPIGVLATTMNDAFETSKVIIDDLNSGKLSTDSPGRDEILKKLTARGISVVSFRDWEKIDAAEVKSGSSKGKPREKIHDIDEMLRIALEQ